MTEVLDGHQQNTKEMYQMSLDYELSINVWVQQSICMEMSKMKAKYEYTQAQLMNLGLIELG